jgi:hypothetical protein
MPLDLALADGLDNRETWLKTSKRLGYNLLEFDEYA